MKSKPFEFAVYGKGGIGKSTVSANLSAALGSRGKRIMQIGCDPKHDSTRLLMHGRVIPTVLDYLRETRDNEARLEDVLWKGCFDIGCIEAGGPKPGVGCAGRGIISAFEFMEKHAAKDPYDLVIYDVLGDVVCGGFAVPVRREYADAVFLVTSGEYMALYAANNILRGIRNFDGDTHSRVAGIVYNARNVDDEDARVKRFADAVGLPIIVKVPRSNAFARAEALNRTITELEDGPEKMVFARLAAHAERLAEGHEKLYKARPLSDEDLEHVVLGTVFADKATAATDAAMNTVENTDGSALSADANNIAASACTDGSVSADPSVAAGESAGACSRYDNDFSKRPPLYGCAFNGAATTAVHITDALVIAHSPKACAFYTWQNISSSGRRNLFNRGILMPSAIVPHFECTNMNQEDVVFGGMDRLKAAVREALDRKPGAVIVISSCVSGIIGDDLKAVEAMSTPDIPVIAIEADGDIAGDYMEGIRLCLHTLGDKLIDREVKPAGRLVNFINEKNVSNNLELNYQALSGLLAALDIRVNCRYPGDCTVDELRHLKAAPLNILDSDSADGLELKAWLEKDYGMTFMDTCFPIGPVATGEWLRKIGRHFDCEDKALALISDQLALYEEELVALRPALEGKTILMTSINVNQDWLMDAAEKAGMRFVWIGVFNYLHTPLTITDNDNRKPLVSEDYSPTTIRRMIETHHPDFVLSNYGTTEDDDVPYIKDTLPMVPAAGFRSAVPILRRWADMLHESDRRKEDWRHDAALFEKYFS
ncbi:MAG: nitrogenase component 1 [Lachnospiraceae bacterium]|nr:nitrogenase component 1 [Lachnospiraceae bacterium]